MKDYVTKMVLFKGNVLILPINDKIYAIIKYTKSSLSKLFLLIKIHEINNKKIHKANDS